MAASFLPYIGAFIWIGFLLCLGVVLRAKIKFLQTLLMPASLIGGLIGFALMRFDLVGLPMPEGYVPISEGAFALITFHLFAFNFLGAGLIKSEKHTAGEKIAKGAAWIALMLSATYGIQALIGMGVFAGWNIFTGSENNILNGVLLGVGFTQGPGQAQAFATIWEMEYNFANAINIGFAFAATGFLAAGLLGVPLAKYLVSKGKTEAKDLDALSSEFTTGILKPENHTVAALDTTHNANVNTLGFHFAIMLFLYGISYCIALFIQECTPPFLASLAFGLLFLLTLLVGKAFIKIVTIFKADHVIDNGTTKSLTSACVDLLICGVFLGIDVEAIQSLIVPILIASLLAGIATVIVCVYCGNHLSEYKMERAMVLLGYATGTGANALLLLRIVDPKFTSPIMIEMGLVIVVQVVTFIPFFNVVIPAVPVLGTATVALLMAGAFVVSLALTYTLIYFQNKGKL